MKKTFLFSTLASFLGIALIGSFTSAEESNTEFNDAYNFAFEKKITTQSGIENADMEWGLTRIAMAKMLSQYAINVLEKKPTNNSWASFKDVTEKLDDDYSKWVTLAYQLGIMWIGIDKFRPFDMVTRAEFATALSRMLYGTEDGDPYYSTHLAKLKEEGIISNDNPNLQEVRGYVMIMLMRSAKDKSNSNETEEPANPEKKTVQSVDMTTYLELIGSHTPDGYSYSIYNNKENAVESTWTHMNTPEEIGYLTPENHHIVDREITSSGIEDGMIYTIVKSTFDDKRVIDILYVINPTTYNFVAASYQDWDKSYNYQFIYNEKEAENSTGELYSVEELAVAEYTIKTEWFGKWDVKVENIKLKYLWDEKAKSELNYCKEIWEANNIMVDECAVFESEFFVPEQDAMMAWALEPNKTLTGYQWYLGRIKSWSWNIITAWY